MSLQSPSSNFASMSVLFGAAVWGIYWLPLRYLEDMGISGAWPVALLNIAPVFLFVGWVLTNWPKHRQYLGAALIIGLLTGLAFAMYGAGLIYTSVMRATLLYYLTPIWATLIGIFWLGEKATWQRWLAIVGGLLGLSVLVSGGPAMTLNIGDLYGFLSGVFWAFGASMIKRLPTVPLPTMAAFQSISVVVGALLLGAVAGNQTLLTGEQIWAAIPVSLGISVCLIMPSAVILIWAQKFLSPGRVGLLMMSEVLVAAITASILLPDERMSMLEWFGAALIVGACLIEILLTPMEQAHPPNH
ncbi:MAG: DMT family transporter [Gammaproteobacteria bacterium]|nr:DMT family transporter [Gammaproteobacteria bacterium]MCP4879543.1 DMT family transporter [Gammaproteobacteria bacterium]